MYCTVCGMELENIGPIIRYSSMTGKPIYEQRCPKNQCHQGHKFKRIPDKDFWSRLSAWKEYRCEVCGEQIEYFIDGTV